MVLNGPRLRAVSIAREMGLAFTGIRRAGLAVGYGERIASRYVCSVMRYAIAFPMPVSRAMTQSPSAEDSPLFVAALALASPCSGHSAKGDRR